jgi:succinate dehydrogenase/fumarate reductase cytochrome b subunit
MNLPCGVLLFFFLFVQSDLYVQGIQFILLNYTATELSGNILLTKYLIQKSLHVLNCGLIIVLALYHIVNRHSLCDIQKGICEQILLPY